jgi:hypothetical protein
LILASLPAILGSGTETIGIPTKRARQGRSETLNKPQQASTKQCRASAKDEIVPGPKHRHNGGFIDETS